MKSNTRILSAREAAEHLGITPRKLKDLRNRRLINSYKMGYRTIAYDRASLDRYLHRVCSRSMFEENGE